MTLLIQTQRINKNRIYVVLLSSYGDHSRDGNENCSLKRIVYHPYSKDVRALLD